MNKRISFTKLATLITGIALVNISLLTMSGCEQLKKINTDKSQKQIEEETDMFSEKHFQSGDKSVIYFEKDGTFTWYQTDDDHDDNYYTGSYELFCSKEAIEHITDELSAYAVTQKELDDLFERNSDNDEYTEENFCVLVLHNETLVSNSTETDISSDTPYMGFYVNEIFDCANMNTGNYASFTLQE